MRYSVLLANNVWNVYVCGRVCLLCTAMMMEVAAAVLMVMVSIGKHAVVPSHRYTERPESESSAM